MPFAGDWAGTLNGLAFGGPTAFDLKEIAGWHDMAASPLGGAGTMAPKQTRNGSWAVPEFMPSRVVTMALQIQQLSGDFETAIGLLEAATQPGVGEIPLTLQMGGVSSTVNGTVTGRTIPTTLDYLAGYTNAQIEVTCSDPRRFGALVTGSALLPTSTGGLTWSVTWPLTWNSTQVAGQVILANPGNTAGPVKFRITGPVTGPVVTHVESGTQFAMVSTFAMQPGDYLDVDCEARSVILNGQASRNGYIQTRGWPQLLPGTNTFNFSAAGYNPAAQLSVTATPSWI
jgi:hypothetical protein